MIAGGARVVNLAEPLVYYRVGDGAYERRGGRDLLRSELRLQREMYREGFISRAQYWRNVTIRGGYRLVPTVVRRPVYRWIVAPYGARRNRSRVREATASSSRYVPRHARGAMASAPHGQQSVAPASPADPDPTAY
jgi:hypothetical protein